MQDYFHPDEIAITALSEEFGAFKYVDYQENNSTVSIISTNLLWMTCVLVLYCHLTR